MTHEEILEGNQIIIDSQFSDMTQNAIIYNGVRESIGYTSESFYSLWGNKSHHLVRYCQYHYSYEWLMPVVERIEELGYVFEIKKNTVRVLGKQENPYEWNGGTTNDSKLLAIWYAVVEFIKWYNTL